MKQDPFGNLTDWGTVLDLFDELGENGGLAACQPGLVRILSIVGNWRLREEVLKRIGEIQDPSDDLISQVIRILADDNIYYDARILAGEALIRLLKATAMDYTKKIGMDVRKVAENCDRHATAFFRRRIQRISRSRVSLPGMLEN